MIDGALQIHGVDQHSGPPVVYLPGVGREQLRAIEDAPAGLQPIAELQYRGTIFSQPNGRDWTIRAFLGSDGLGLDVAGDNATKDAIRQARPVLGSVAVSKLQGATPLRAGFFHDLVAPDHARLALEWLDDPQVFQAGRSGDEWAAFRAQFRKQYGLDLVEDGPVAIAEALGRRLDEAWASLWRRFCEAPKRYPNIPARLRAARPRGLAKGNGLFDRLDSWPQVNEEEEAQLRKELSVLPPSDAAAARTMVVALDARHRGRRDWVWAQLGMAPLAIAMDPLAELARLTANVPNGADVGAIAAQYTGWGWRADAAVMRALAAPNSAPDTLAVQAAVRALYASWLESSCAAFQKAVATSGYAAEKAPDWPSGTCVIFTDGLRFDIGKRLAAVLEARGFTAGLKPWLSALPSITPTAKPFVSPASTAFGTGQGLVPALLGGAPRATADVLRKQIAAAGYQVLGPSDAGDPAGRAWSELGDIDSLGHEHTSKLPRLIDGEVASLAERIIVLLGAGWKQVVVVTDHGWLYLPGGLPKVEMPQHLTQDGAMRKARCGRLAAGASTAMQTVPWTWDTTVAIAIAPGSSAFEIGQAFEHGGVSPQECVTPMLLVTPTGTPAALGPVRISVHWRGLRATVNVEGAPSGSHADLRRKAGDPASSLLVSTAAVANGEAKFLVEDSDAQGTAAFVIILDASGNVVAQLTLTVGEDA